MIPIDSEDDERLADYRNVPDPQLVKERGIFIAEGRLVVRRLLEESALAARSVMVTEAALAGIAEALARRPELPVYLVPQAVMNLVTGFNIHRGCLAIGERRAPIPWTRLVAGARTVLVLERIGNADNVGGIFRNAIAFGVDAVLLGPACADPLYRKAIRTSMGATLLVPFARVDPWPDALRQLRELGFSTIALTPASDAISLRDLVTTLAGRRAAGGVGGPAAIVVGHEGEGLTTEAMEACDHRARIPMSGFDSLNVASAAAIALYELKRAG